MAEENRNPNVSSDGMTHSGIAIEEQPPMSEFSQSTEEPIKLTRSIFGKLQTCKCLICNTFHCEGSMASHLNSKHQQGRIYGKTYIKYDENGVLQKESKKGRKIGITKTSKYSYKRPVKCLLCEYKGNEQSIYHHLQSKHNQGQQRGINFEVTGEENVSTKTYKKNVQIIKKDNIPEGKYITIPVYIRIPVVFGNVEIVGNE